MPLTFWTAIKMARFKIFWLALSFFIISIIVLDVNVIRTLSFMKKTAFHVLRKIFFLEFYLPKTQDGSNTHIFSIVQAKNRVKTPKRLQSPWIKKNAEFGMTKTRHYEILYSIIKGIVNFKNLLLLPIADKLPGVNKLYRRSRCKFTATFSWLPEKRHWWTFQLRFNAWKRYHDERTTGICRCKCTLSYPFSFPIRLLCMRIGMVLK